MSATVRKGSNPAPIMALPLGRALERVQVVEIIPNARKSYHFRCLEESDEKHFSWQAQHIVDLKVEKGDFAAQAQGFVKVTRLRRSYIGT